MKVLGLDPGIERLGYAILSEKSQEITAISYGLISTDYADAKPKRLRRIYDDINELIERYEPEKVSIETLIFAKNVKTAMTVSEVRGVLLLTATLHNIAIEEFTPLQVKTAVTGYGRASKSQIQHAVKILLKLSEIPRPDDVADAIAIAMCGIFKR